MRSVFKRLLGVVCVIAGAWSTTASAAPQTAAFGSLLSSTIDRNLTANWTAVRDQVEEDARELSRAIRRPELSSDPVMARIALKVEHLRYAPLHEKLDSVNKLINREIQYTSDTLASGQADRWLSPSEALRIGGDCEDYSIAKYVILRALGVDEKKMRIIVLRDTARDLGHAVLTVAHDVGQVVLDNVSNALRVDRNLPQYRAIYSIQSGAAYAHLNLPTLRRHYFTRAQIALGESPRPFESP
jgi:predicted transglutaminase-like cysteine proteinase